MSVFTSSKVFPGQSDAIARTRIPLTSFAVYPVTDGAVGRSVGRRTGGRGFPTGSAGPVASPRSTTRVCGRLTATAAVDGVRGENSATLLRGRERSSPPTGRGRPTKGAKAENGAKKYRARSRARDGFQIRTAAGAFLNAVCGATTTRYIHARTRLAQRPPIPPLPLSRPAPPAIPHPAPPAIPPRLLSPPPQRVPAPPATATYARGFCVRETRSGSGPRRSRRWDLSAVDA